MIVLSRPGPAVVTLTVALGVVLGTGVVAAFDPEAIDVSARALPRLHSLIVSQRGEVIFERYYNRATAARPANVKSVSKSVISTLVGIAIDAALIPACAADRRPTSPSWPVTRIRASAPITIEDLLTMRSGLSRPAATTTARG